MGEGDRSRNIRRAARQSAVIPLLWRAQEQNGGWLPQKPRSDMSPTCSAWRTSARSRSRPSTRCSFWSRSARRRTSRSAARRRACCAAPTSSSEVCKQRIHHDPLHVSADGNFSWDEVECLGACVNAPMVQICNDYLRGPDGRELRARRLARSSLAAGGNAPPKPRSREIESRQTVGAGIGGRDARFERPVDHEPKRLMLADKDRIFTNLYGLHDWGLEGRAQARRLGRHQGDPREGPRRDHQRDEGVGPARPRRRGLPDRPEMVVHAEGSRTGGRTISSSMPTSPSPAPARTARSCGTIRISWSRAA